MKVLQQISLKKYNTFGIEASAHHFVHVQSEEDLRKALLLKEYPQKLILGGGSNMLITGDVHALVIHMDIRGIQLVSETDGEVVLKVMGGENWHQLVLWTLEKGYGGLQNLSLIPGNTGTAPIQNIGAYGVELKDIFECCEAMDRDSLEIKTFSRDDCRFGYRESFFKNEGKDRYILTSVSFRLTKKDHHIQTEYGDIEAELAAHSRLPPSIKDVSDAVIAIRRRKLPDPAVLGNSGSFFKNPVLSAEEFSIFTREHPSAPYYSVADNSFKVPAGWMIEQCGFKGKRFGDAGVHSRQALVLVNHGNATGQDILNLASNIQKTVLDRFGVRILPEVNIIG